MKTALVNFETFFVPPEQHLNVIMKDIKEAVEQGCDCIVGLFLVDGFIHNNIETIQLLEHIQTASKELGIKQLHLLPGMGNELDIEHLDYTVWNFDYNIHMSYNSYVDKLNLLHPWNPNTNKFLFLGGVPNRPNRIQLLEKFYRAKMLNNAEWSFFKPWTAEQQGWCRMALSEYTEDEYNDFLNYCERSIDKVYQSSKHYGTQSSEELALSGAESIEWWKDPNWIDPSLYASTSLSIISEGYYTNDFSAKFITEKTLRAIIQRHPLLMATNSKMYDYFKLLGFKTFSEYMSIPNYPYIEDEQERLTAIVPNTKHFFTLMPMDGIQADIDYNFEHFFKLAEDNVNQLLKMKTTLNISQQDMDHWINRKGCEQLIRAYNGN